MFCSDNLYSDYIGMQCKMKAQTLFIYILIDFRGRGLRRERWGRERDKHPLYTPPGIESTTRECAPTGNQADVLLVYVTILNPLSHTNLSKAQNTLSHRVSYILGLPSTSRITPGDSFTSLILLLTTWGWKGN